MNSSSRSRWVFVAVLFLLTGAWLLMNRVSAQAKGEASNMFNRAKRLETEANNRAAMLRAEVNELTIEQTHAVQQLEELRLLLQSPMERAPADLAQQVRLVVERVRWMQKLFKQRPELQIPEMALLTDMDWLSASRFADLSTEEGLRKALGQVRTEAKHRFCDKISPALNAYAKVNGTARPASMLALAPYFKGGIDPALLQRWEIGSASPMVVGAIFQIQESRPVDADYDTFIAVTDMGHRLMIEGKNKGGIASVTKEWKSAVALPVDWKTYLLLQGQVK